MQRKQVRADSLCDWCTGVECATDLGGAGQKHEDVADESFVCDPRDRPRDAIGERPLVGTRVVFDRDVEQAPLRSNGRTIAEKRGDWRRL